MFLLLAGCLLLMDRPPKCPESCDGHFACDSTGTCAVSCSTSEDCEDGYYCYDILETCEPVCHAESCPGNYGCEDTGTCSTFCFDKSECKDGYRCNDYGECVTR